MKKGIKLIAVALVLAGNAFAQSDRTDAREAFTIGLKAGANYANVYDSEGEDFNADGKLGFAGGGYLTIPLGMYLGIQPEVLFSQKGFTASGNFLGSGYKVTRTSDFLDIPVLFMLKPSEFLTVVAGPQFSYLIKQTDVFANATTSIEQEKEFENDDIRTNTLCFVGGVDINLRHLVIGARAGWDLQSNRSDGSSTTPRYKNTWLQATIAYRLYR